MSYLTVLLVISSASLCFAHEIDPAYKKMIKDAGSKCKEQYSIGDETIKDMVEMKTKLENENEKCFAGCMLETLGVIKGNTYNADFHKSINVKKYLESSDIEKAHQVVDTCKDEVMPNDDLCQLGYDIVKCMITETKKVGLQPPSMSS